MPGPTPSIDSSMDPENEQIADELQPRWSNMVHLAFVAANIVSDDVSTVTAGLFPEGEGLVKGSDLSGDEWIQGIGGEAFRASAAAASIPVLLCASPAAHGSLALSARVLGMFTVISRGSSTALHKLCTARSTIPNQGPLVFPLLRLSLFLLVRLHPCSESALENVNRLQSLAQVLLSAEWEAGAGTEPMGSDDMCMVILAHVHAGLLRLKAQMTNLSEGTQGATSELTGDGLDTAVPDSSVLPPGMSVANAWKFGEALLGLLRYLTQRRLDLLSSRLGERLISAVVDVATAEPREWDLSKQTGSRSVDPAETTDERRLSWIAFHKSIAWMEDSPLFSPSDVAMNGSHGMPALLEACMPSLKVHATLLL